MPNPDKIAFRKGEVIVELRPGVSVDTINARYKTRTIAWLYGTNIYRLGTPNGKKEKKFQRKLRKDDDVVSAELNPVVVNPTVFARAFQSFPNDRPIPGKLPAEYASQQELLNLLQMQAVWEGSLGEGVVVAVIDTGVNRAHPDLTRSLWTDGNTGDVPGDNVDNEGDGLIDDTYGWDFVDNDNDPTEAAGDPETTVAGHGTFIAGIVKMMAPRCKILPVRAVPPDGLADAFTVASAIKYATDHGATVINLSLGAPETSKLMADAIASAIGRGVRVVAAAGNENRESPAHYPASDQGVMAVAAIDLASKKAGFSNFGSHIYLAAPGVNLVSTYPDNGGGGYAQWSGTSFAAPFVAAEAALVLEVAPNANIREVIGNTAVNIDGLNPEHTGKLGRGRIDPLEALKLVGGVPVRDIHRRVALARTAAAASGAGRAAITVFGSHQEFEVEAFYLNPHTSYTLVVNGSVIGPSTTGRLGDLKIEYSTERGPLPAALNPVTNIQRVELRLGDTTVLQGTFGPATADRQTSEKEARLISANVPGAGGRAKVKVEPERETLELQVGGLPAGNYTIIADATTVGVISIRATVFTVRFTSDGSSGRLLPPVLSPVTRVSRIEVRNGAGVTVLAGNFVPGGDAGRAVLVGMLQ